MRNTIIQTRPGVWMLVPATDDQPLLVNGRPWDFVPEHTPVIDRVDCWCRRCYLHDDPAGCVADEQFAGAR